MAKAFVIDVAKCSGCFNCQLACKDEHCGNDWRPYAAPQPEIGQFWVKVQENVCGTIPKVRIHYIAKLCGHCADAACVNACNHNAISRRADGFVLIDPEKCTGCRECMSACPHDVIYFSDELNIAQKCTGCAHLLDNGFKQPRCSEACPTDAMVFGEESELSELIEGAVCMDSDAGARVYYKNIPGRFIAGTVYDPAEKEVVIGGRCAISGDRQMCVETDDFGDFWFRDLPVGSFQLTISADGFEDRVFTGLSTEKDINLGDIPLKRGHPEDNR